ncbi:MAG: tRNA uridine-5-carboxymethylaminomethyl(34) synthesis GTPase MnmE [Myxococcota bacterium]
MVGPTTIAAIATPPGQGGVGIVRVSGPAARTILAAVCPSLPAPPPAHRLVLTHAYRPNSPEQLDEVLAVWMPAPGSYTAEDVFELQGHGGALNMQRLLEAVCDAGATPAGPGEFTQRAFFNGRLDLTQAEAVADIIHASTEAALTLAQSHLGGSLGHTIRTLQEELTTATTLTEAAIDFSTEEHVYQLDTDQLVARLDRVLGQARRLLGNFDAGRQLRDGVRVVILGRPNAGKSTLFNLLCGLPRAIVTDTPGTTRDYLEELVLVEGVALRLIDTAGLRDTDDEVEAIGVARSRDQAARADVVLWLLDLTDPQGPTQDECNGIDQLSGDILPIFNKADQPQRLPDTVHDTIAALTSHPPLHTSLVALEQAAPATLLEALATIARRRLQPPEEGAIITRQRHRQALLRAIEAMERARHAAVDGMSHEFIALDLRLALEATGAIVGQVTTDMLLNRIFSEFCVGK